MPVGKPFPMEAGGHVISVRIRNGFYEGEQDVRKGSTSRNMSFVRVDQAAVPHTAGGGSMMSMVERRRIPALPTSGSMMSMVAHNTGSHTVGDLHVVFANNIDGQMVTGAVDVEALCFWPDRDHDHAPPPRVELYVNGALASAQSGRHPHFTIDPAAFKVGTNSDRAARHAALRRLREERAVHAQRAARFPPVEAHLPALAHLHPLRLRPERDRSVPERQDDPEITTLYSNGTCTIKLPDESRREIYKVLIQARGDQYDGPPLCSVELKSGGKDDKLGEFPGRLDHRWPRFPAVRWT